MKKNVIFLAGLVLALIAVSCSEDVSITKTPNDDVLGLVVPGTTVNESKTILLTDGRTIKPVSGISNFNDIRPGKKFLLSFTTGEDHDGVIDAHVSKFVKAENRDFISSARTVSDDSIPSGTLTGSFYFISGDSTITAEGSTTVTLEEGNYTCTASPTGYPVGGSGTYTINGGTFSFHDTNTWPAGTNPDFVLNGDFTFYMYAKKHVTFMRINGDGTLVLYQLSLQ